MTVDTPTITWPTARDLAGMPGMPGTERGVRMRALREGWHHTHAAVRGGMVVCYDPASLPLDVRMRLASQAVAGTSLADETRTESATELAQRTAFVVAAPARKLKEPDANRTRVLVLFQRWWAAVGGPLHPALDHFAVLWGQGAIQATPELRRAVPKFNASTLRRWWLTMQERGSLAREPHPRRGQFQALSGELGTAVLSVLSSKPHLSAAHVRDLIVRHGMVPADQIPSERAFRRAIQAFKADNAQAWLAHTNPDAWRSSYLAASGDAAAHITRPNQQWQMDSTVGDCMLVDPDSGEIRRHHLVACIDVFTRRVMFLVTRTSKANAIAALIRKCIDAWGKPESIKTDNGSDYTAEQLEFALLQLGISHPLCDPFEPQQKPYVERVFGTLLHGLFPLLTGFIGHNVGQRKAIESARSFAERLFGKKALGMEVELRFTPAQLQAMVDNWTADYLADTHGTLGISPNEQTERHLREIVRVDARALDMFLSPIAADELRTIGKKGIKVDKGVFTAVELGGLEGKQVRVRMSEAEIGQLYVFDLDGAFLCIATDTSRLGVTLQEVSAKRKAKQQQVIERVKDVMKHARRAYDTDAAVRDVYLDRQAKAIEQSDGKVKRLPPREVLGTTPAIESALSGLENRAQGPKVPAHQQQAVAAAMARLEGATPAAQVFRVANTPNDRYSTWLRMRSRTDQGQAITPAERTWFDSYATSSECRAMERLHQGHDPLAAQGGGD